MVKLRTLLNKFDEKCMSVSDLKFTFYLYQLANL